MAAPERFAKRQIPLAPRAPSIHGPERHLLRDSNMSEIGGKAEEAGARLNVANDPDRTFQCQASRVVV